ncbi:MAG: peptidoglycan DD-metalloendopeptidase family protein [Burkholderiaceae bacterium]|nr:peptidoglycan DD-metalloendopeptidase family protein [Burkholderiaceae bacterium]
MLMMAVALLGVAASADAAKVSERAKQKKLAEIQRADLQEKLAQLKHEIDNTEVAKSHASDALAESEAAISDADRALHDLAQEQQAEEAKLAKIVKQQEDLKKAIALQQQKLSNILREQYVAGNEDRIKLLLSGDNPNRINRELQYMGYVSQSQAKLIDALRKNLQALEANKVETQEAKDELDEIAQEQLQQKAVLEREKAQRALLLTKLSSKLATQRKEAGNMEHNEQRLAGLVDKLSKLIEEQQKADAAAARRKEEQARAKAEAERRAQQANAAKLAAAKAAGTKAPPPAPVEIKTPNPADAIDADEPPPTTLAKVEPTPLPKVEEGIFPHDFSALRGQLRLPVRGELVAKFGGKHGDGPSWKGLFIRAEEGAEVKAVAGGRVVFAEWLRGFGNLIIVDHGNQYMTIYGNNQAVLKRAGDVVKAGETIANAGNSGGNEQSGLYFEMRHQGRAFDPLGWVTIR